MRSSAGAVPPTRSVSFPTRPAVATSPAFRRLLAELRPTIVDTVDMLHVAAILESRGITDALARERYGSEDVFDLAASLRARALGGLAVARRSGGLPHPGSRMTDLRTSPRFDGSQIARSTTGHGAIYLLPALSMPALLALAGSTYGVLALIVGGALGWFWAAVTSWRAYAEWSSHGREPAQVMLAQLILLGVGLGIAAGAVLVVLVGLPPIVGLVSAAVTAAQLSATLLFFRDRRAVLVLILLVPALVGAAYLMVPHVVSATTVLMIFVGASLVALVVGIAPLLRFPQRQWQGPSLAWVTVPGMGWVAAYGVASVTFLLLPQGVVLGSVPHGVMALVGLFLAMGVVEWRAARFTALLRHQLVAVDHLGAFRWRAAWLALRECCLCLVTTAVLSALVLLALREVGLYDERSIVVALTGVLLGATYLLAQVLANAGAYVWLAGSFTLGVLVEVSAWPLGLSIIHAFCIAAGVILVALFAGLLTMPVHRYR